MPTVLCVDDFTKVFVRRHRAAARRRVRSLAAADRATALELAADTPMDAVILNCHREPDNSALVTVKNPPAACSRNYVLWVLRHPLQSVKACRRMLSEGQSFHKPYAYYCGPCCAKAGMGWAA
jgi:hypothetical protein